MKILFLVKEVPDTYRERQLNLATGLAECGVGAVAPDEFDERTLEGVKAGRLGSYRGVGAVRSWRAISKLLQSSSATQP